MSDTATLRERTAEEIRVLLARKKLSGSELARKVGVTQPYISRRLNGDVAFDLDDLERIASVLEVDVLDLLPTRREGRVVGTAGTTKVVDTASYRPATNGQASKASSTKAVFRPPTYPGDERGNLSLRRASRRKPANKLSLV